MSAVSSRSGGLGRGLGELFQRTDIPSEAGSDNVAEPVSAPLADGTYFTELSVEDIQPNPKQPRRDFDEDELAELAASIKEVGLLQPVVVREIKPDGYQLVVGERRWRAHQLAQIGKIPAIVKTTDDDDLLRDALLENLHRAQLNPLEEAAAYQQLLADFGCSKEELATRIKRSRPHISNTLRLLQLPTGIQKWVAAGLLTAGHARALLRIPDLLEQERLAQRIIAEGLSVRATEAAVALAHTKADYEGSGPRQKRPIPREIQVGADILADRLDTRVNVSMGAKKGRLTIEFADQKDLNRIMSLIGSQK